MKLWPLYVGVFVTLGLLFVACDAAAQTCEKGTCVPPEDMEVFVALLRAQKCRMDTPPKFTADSVTIVQDRDGRIFATGDNPNPFKLKMEWCNYQIDATSQIKIIAAKRPEPTWGFRFRPKFSSGILFGSLIRGDKLDSVDVGLLVEGFYYKFLNLNLAAGFRSVGLGLGVDVTRNFGGYVGYAVAYDGWQSNPYVGLSFAFW